MPGRTVDQSFLALPLSALTDAALTRAVDLGCEHADIRVERIRTQTISLRDARLESLADGEDLGLSVRVVHEGTWGFAAGVVLTAAEAVRLAEEAVAVAKVASPLSTDRVELAPGPPARVGPAPSRCTRTRPGSRTTPSTPSRWPMPRRPPCSPSCPSSC